MAVRARSWRDDSRLQGWSPAELSVSVRSIASPNVSSGPFPLPRTDFGAYHFPRRRPEVSGGLEPTPALPRAVLAIWFRVALTELPWVRTDSSEWRAPIRVARLKVAHSAPATAFPCPRYRPEPREEADVGKERPLGGIPPASAAPAPQALQGDGATRSRAGRGSRRCVLGCPDVRSCSRRSDSLVRVTPRAHPGYTGLCRNAGTTERESAATGDGCGIPPFRPRARPGREAPPSRAPRGPWNRGTSGGGSRSASGHLQTAPCVRQALRNARMRRYSTSGAESAGEG